jgi:hypothetical protein
MPRQTTRARGIITQGNPNTSQRNPKSKREKGLKERKTGKENERTKQEKFWVPDCGLIAQLFCRASSRTVFQFLPVDASDLVCADDAVRKGRGREQARDTCIPDER